MSTTHLAPDYRSYEVRIELHRVRDADPLHLETPRDVAEFMSSLSKESSEFVYEIMMDARRRVTGVYLIGKGGPDSSTVDPKEIYKVALLSNSPAFTLVHNHPSGDATPSVEDEMLARVINEGSGLLALQMVDFLILGAAGTYFSFSEAGRL
jgi:DNA repair protein RadC